MKTIIRKKEYLREVVNIMGTILDFKKEPLAVSDEIADYCLTYFPDRFEIREELNEEQQKFIELINDDMEIEDMKKIIIEYNLLPSLKGSGNIQSKKAFIAYVLNKLG